MRAQQAPAPRKSNAMLNHRPARMEVSSKPPKSKPKPSKVPTTSTAEGKDLGLMVKAWQNLAASECRIELMNKLKILNLGLADVEEFNLGLKVNFRSEKSRNKLERGENKFVKAAMDSKFEDELTKNSEYTRERNRMRRELAGRLGKNSRTYNRVIKNLISAARAEKEDYKKRYKQKLEHLQRKYREDEETKLDRAPSDIQEFSNLSIFDNEKFSRISPVVYDTAVVGDITLDEDEQAILRLNPKFSVVQPLLQGGLEFEQEQAYAKVRMELNKELAEQVENPIEITEE